MRAERFRRRDGKQSDLTEVIAEARAARINGGFFGICGLGMVAGLVAIGIAASGKDSVAQIAYGIAAGLLLLVALLEASLSLRSKVEARHRHAAATRLTLLTLFIGLAAAIIHQSLAPEAILCRDVGLWLIFAGVVSTSATLLMPWTMAQSMTASAPAFVVWLASVFMVPNPASTGMGLVSLAVVGVVVGAIPLWIGYLTERRYEDDDERAALSREVSHTRDELSRARIVHDAMFKPPLEEGPVEVTYRYDPLREIGGDFVHIVRDPGSDRVTTTVIDVAGHGLAAALTVNRLFGELERVVAEAKGDVTPSVLMTQLNRYIHLTMSAHSMFATAACVQVDPRARQVQWVVAGHPPPLMRLRNGKVERLDCTTLVLGAAAPEDFDTEQQARPIEPGDCVIIYTDGTFEARCPTGERFGLRKLEESVAFDPPPRDFPTFLANLVARYHEGQPDDDLLVAQITFRGGVRTVVPS
ncbi:MAG: serine/threonine-protein phosphatase [Phycisphaerae bacterium]|nr:serine/threonine-protein phosphatase [Phycisphaerae bacterium]